MEPNTEISIYAELLPNIRRMVLTILLPSPPTDSSRVYIHADRASVSVHHQDTTTEVPLPGQPAGSVELLQGSKKTTTDLVFRIPLREGVDAAVTAANGRVGEDGEADVPWSADTLRAGSAVRCRACRGCESVVVEEGRVGEWKDLPSENWAEMMEFWHCHKPDHQHHHHHNGQDGQHGQSKDLASRGYGADSILTAQRGVGFVDLMTFLFAREDCQGITLSPTSSEEQDGPETEGSTEEGSLVQTTNSSRPRTLDISCSSCKSQLGYFNFRTQAVTLFKWQVVVQTTSTTPSSLPSISNCLTSALAAAFAQSGSAKSFLMPLEEENDHDDNDKNNDDGGSSSDAVLHIWVLNKSIRFTSTAVAERRVVPAMKVMWRVVSTQEAEKILESIVAREQEVNLPREAIAAVRAELERSNLMYPEKDRAFQDWRVGFLQSWERSPR